MPEPLLKCYLTFKRPTFAYANAKCIGSSTNDHRCECTCCNTGLSISLSLPVHAGIQSEILDIYLLTAVYRVTQMKAVVINCNTNYFVSRGLHSNNRALLSAYRHVGFHISNTCAIYVGSRATEDERNILHDQYMLHNHAEGTGFGTCEQEGSPAESKSDVRAEYGQQQR